MTADTPTSLFLGQGQEPCHVLLKYANRHGLVTGATGTGKTVTLQVLAEAFSRAGVPVFCADVKGDLAGVAAPGGGNSRVETRAEEMGLAPLAYAGAPTVFWDLFGEKGHPVRTTVSEMGPLLLARLLGLNEVQEGVLAIALRVADEEGLALLDLKDLRQLLIHVGQNASQLTLEYGNVSEASVGAIQRALLALESQGANPFFGEPALELPDLMRSAPDGRGIVNVLAADRLMQSPKAYATFLLWLLAELFEQLPEVGDPDKPKLVFFFDEAHLLFEGAPKALLDKIEQVVKLIRSKGVGIWFVTQNPLDVPESVLAQLGNRVQHALRAFTPREQRAVRTAAETFRPNPAFSTQEVITQLAVGEALVSPLLDKGIPAIVERATIRPPASRIGVLTDAERAALIAASPVMGKYDTPVDRESAYEILRRRAEAAVEERVSPAPAPSPGGIIGVTRSGGRAAAPKAAPKPKAGGSSRQSVTEAFTKSTVRSVGSVLGRELTRGILGSLFKKK